jgi:mRNA-degrading endonuclease toxin of MazEF toxin-antitoxin module
VLSWPVISLSLPVAMTTGRLNIESWISLSSHATSVLRGGAVLLVLLTAQITTLHIRRRRRRRRRLASRRASTS